MDRDVRVRLLAAPLVLAVVLGALALHDATGSALTSHLLLMLVTFGAGYELARLLLGHEASRTWILVGLGAALFATVGWIAPEDADLRMQLRVVLVVLAVVVPLSWRLEDTRPEAAGAIARAILATLLGGLLLSFLVELYLGPQGARRLAFVVVVAKASDMGAWAVGRAIGRHRLLPSVSPAKTWEGLIGGVAASVAAALMLPAPLQLGPEQSWGEGSLAAYGVLLALTSALAGLIHSGLKRRAGTKDSGALVPVLGGVLDLVDSLLLAAPAAWLWMRLA